MINIHYKQINFITSGDQREPYVVSNVTDFFFKTTINSSELSNTDIEISL